jgi:hypothetical protein
MKQMAICLVGVSVLAFSLSLLAGEPTLMPAATQAADSQVPWGKEADGLVCRLIAPKVAFLNEPMVLTLEVKNVSNRARYLVDLGKFIQKDHYMNNECAELSYIGPDGKESRPGVHAGYGIVPTDFKPIAPGEVKRSSIRMLANMTYAGLASPVGEWKMKLALTSPKPARAVVGNIGRVVGNTMVAEPVYGEPSKDQVDNAWVGTIQAEAAVRISGDAPKLTVHEWGVFCSFADDKYANADRKQEWASMPDEFYRQFPTHKLRGVEVLDPNPPRDFTKKPIIYFYSDRQNLHLEVKLTFAQGAPAVWWPCAQLPLDDGSGKPGDIFRTLQWSGKLTADGSEEVGAGFRISDYTVKTGPDSWVNQARIDGPAWFVTDDQPKFVPPPGPPNQVHTARNGIYGFRNQSEKFIYYDGLIPAANYVQCAALADDSVTLENSAKFDMANLIVIDHRAPKAARWALVEKLAAGGRVKAALQSTGDGKTAAAREELGRDLKNAGLFENEVKSALAIWDKGLFDRPGITAIYLLPQSEYDRVLPLAVSPKPDKIIRVGIAMQGQIDLTPTVLAARVKDLIVKMDADDYHVRDKAAQELSALGASAMGAIRKAKAGKLSEEVRIRLDKILEGDAGGYLEKRP